MQVARVTARAGRGWVVSGFALMRRFPIGMMVVTMCYLLLMVVAAALPMVGAFAPLVLTPFLSVGMMHAVRAVAEQRMPGPQMLLGALRDNRGRAWQPLLGLGLLNAASTVLALGASALIDQGMLFEIASGQMRADDPRLPQAPLLLPALMPLLLSALVFLLVYTPMQMALWYSPLFCAWHGLPAIKAMFFSIAAVLRNKWAFLQYALTWMVIALIASVVVQVTKVLLGGSPMLMSLVLSPLSLIVLTALYCSFWPTYREVIVDGNADPPVSPA